MGPSLSPFLYSGQDVTHTVLESSAKFATALKHYILWESRFGVNVEKSLEATIAAVEFVF